MIMRVVLEHVKGPWAGICQILGTVKQVKTDMGVVELPAYIPDINFGDRISGASLVAAKRSYVLYRELIVPDGLKSFNPEQR